MESRGREILQARLRQVHPGDGPVTVLGIHIKIPESQQQHASQKRQRRQRGFSERGFSERKRQRKRGRGGEGENWRRRGGALSEAAVAPADGAKGTIYR